MWISPSLTKSPPASVVATGSNALEASRAPPGAWGFDSEDDQFPAGTLPFPPSFLASLNRLRLCDQWHALALLPWCPYLETFVMSGLPHRDDSVLPRPTFVLPELVSFGACSAVLQACSASAPLRELFLDGRDHTAEQVLSALKGVGREELELLEIRLSFWDDDLPLAIVGRFRQLQGLAIRVRYGAATAEWMEDWCPLVPEALRENLVFGTEGTLDPKVAAGPYWEVCAPPEEHDLWADWTVAGD
ncbi:hypothetical protein FB45DRAFT_891615 [Roridomyces roridus]|uniref:Uncharacterized protein n=1 Tax=Roridomyces roridus TaxID=1738132 RepID=A0AAD7CEN0_9AGAR|nr:hypothetical protein FB45DRAFT_891615 [Roridomyces roridus]